MILPDLNLLLYTYNPHVPHHEISARWWEDALNGEELIGMPNEICLGFVRIATNRRLGAAAVTLEKARAVVELWLELPHVRILIPAANHFARVMDLMSKAKGFGALVSDAALASYAIENRAVLYTNDTDFARFPGLQWHNPLS